MAEIINLRRARKRRDKAQADSQAEQNRITFGRSKAERLLTKTESDKAARSLDAHRLDKPDRSGGEPEP
jgi:hypothetical protein